MAVPEIRSARNEDADSLASVYRSAYRENRDLGFPATAESVTEDEVADWIRDCRVFVAEVDGNVVGGVRLEETDPERVKLSRLGVHEDWKGRGIGSQLLDYVEDAVMEWGHERVWLTTPPEHPYLPALYRDRGYERTCDYPLEYREYDEIVMEKRVG